MYEKLAEELREISWKHQAVIIEKTVKLRNGKIITRKYCEIREIYYKNGEVYGSTENVEKLILQTPDDIDYYINMLNEAKKDEVLIEKDEELIRTGKTLEDFDENWEMINAKNKSRKKKIK